MITPAIKPLEEALGAGWEEHWVERPQGRLRYVCVGRGRPLFLCHGYIGSAENFETWVARLSRLRLLLIPDLAGFGGSDPLAARHSSRALANEVLALADHLGLERFELGGLCLGASVALELLALAPSRPLRLILHTPMLFPRGISRGLRTQGLLATVPGAFQLVAFLGRRRIIADLYRRIAVEGSTEVDRRAANVNFANQLRAHPRAAQEWLRDGLRQDYRPLLLGWRGPVAVLVAADDRLLDLEVVQEYFSLRPLTQVSLIPAAGHGWDRELIRRQLDVLEGFLAPDLSKDGAGPGQS
ncbi:MAG: alpha/beta fold hydrolase [Candidatus Dormibacteria bacterium]